MQASVLPAYAHSELLLSVLPTPRLAIEIFTVLLPHHKLESLLHLLECVARRLGGQKGATTAGPRPHRRLWRKRTPRSWPVSTHSSSCCALAPCCHSLSAARPGGCFLPAPSLPPPARPMTMVALARAGQQSERPKLDCLVSCGSPNQNPLEAVDTYVQHLICFVVLNCCVCVCVCNRRVPAEFYLCQSCRGMCSICLDQSRRDDTDVRCHQCYRIFHSSCLDMYVCMYVC